jgi:protein TonB
MKTSESVRKTETFEDIVFEGRNKSYGAFDLNKKRRKYLLISFLITFIGFTTSVAVPFLGTLKDPGTKTVEFEMDPVIIIGVKPDKPQTLVPPPPPPPALIAKINKAIIYTTPQVVETITDPDDGFELPGIDMGSVNQPADIDIAFIGSGTPEIAEPDETIVHLFPAEPATFMGCPDLQCFTKWIAENIRYPEEAAWENVFGKVILEFCVSSKGKVVDIKVLRSIHPSLDKEAVRVIASSPHWTAAKQGGSPVKQKFVIPCSFEIK